MPQVRDGIRSAAPQSGLSSHLTTQQFMPGKSLFFFILHNQCTHMQPCIPCNKRNADVMVHCGGPVVPSSVHRSLTACRGHAEEQLCVLHEEALRRLQGHLNL